MKTVSRDEFVRSLPEYRERIFILAASREQADLFARRWVQERPEVRRRADAIYLTWPPKDGMVILKSERLVGVEGYRSHRRASQIEAWLRRLLPKTGRPFEVEPVTAS
jgi:hypothetical protein